jgi:phage terminase Nu1 subunit (DNA packaging protein)
MEEEKNLADVSHETQAKQETKLFKKPEGKAMYQKHRDEVDDAETEAFSKGELSKFSQEQAEAATVKRTQKHLKKLQTRILMLLLQLDALKMQKIVSLRKRYDDLKRHYDSTLSKHKDQVRTLKTQLETSTKEFVPPKSKDELDAWKQEYPMFMIWLKP